MRRYASMWCIVAMVVTGLIGAAMAQRPPEGQLSLGVNFTLVGVVAGLALVVALSQAVSPSVAPGSVPGAAALSDTPTRDQAGQPVDTVKGGITPDPLQAPKDVPSLYAVAPDHPDSNYGLARRLLLDELPGVRPDAVHPMLADAPAPATAR